ncbi:MAG: hypothetical protein HY758_09470 [Nitrospirae bacterium]|nr:hypothetical protein [Nitrospirota bacterium]
MAVIRTGKPEYRIEDGWHVASAAITVNDKTHLLVFKASGGPLAKGSDAFLAAAMFTAMKTGGQCLRISGTVSPKLLTAVQTIQAIFHRWFPEYQKIQVEAETGLSGPVSPNAGVGVFFSGGVDSFYTLLKHREETTKVIFVHGLDIKLGRASYRARISQEIQRIARELGKHVIEIETNVHEIAGQYGYNGSLLPSIGLILSPQFHRIYIAANHSYDYSFPDSSHPLLDPLWSTEMLTLKHDGCEANRIEKLARISESDIAMSSLRVCLEDLDQTLNCGQCEKCLRTMIGLQTIGALERCKTFNKKIDIEAVSRVKMRDQLLPFAEENLRVLENNGKDPELAEALRFCLRNYKYTEITKQLNESFKEFLDSPQGDKFVRGKKNSIFKSLWEIDRKWLFREVCKEQLKKIDQKYLFGAGKRFYGTNINK